MLIDIQDAIATGESFEVIARQFDVPVKWVLDAADMLDGYNGYDDSMDGDAASALASAGLGTDEDYGYFGDDF